MTSSKQHTNDPVHQQEQEKEAREGADGALFSMEQVKVDARRAAYGGGLAAGFTLLGAFLVGEAAGSEAPMLLNLALETTRSFCGTVTLALGNILALMLTLLSLSASSDIKLRWSHYQRVKQIAWVVTITLIGSVLIYLLLNIPLEKSENTSAQSFAYLYYITLAVSSILGGAIISVVMMLYNTVKDIIHAVGPGDSDDHLRSDIVLGEEE